MNKLHTLASLVLAAPTVLAGFMAADQMPRDAVRYTEATMVVQPEQAPKPTRPAPKPDTGPVTQIADLPVERLVRHAPARKTAKATCTARRLALTGTGVRICDRDAPARDVTGIGRVAKPSGVL